jgi:hypothetical protein
MPHPARRSLLLVTSLTSAIAPSGANAEAPPPVPVLTYLNPPGAHLTLTQRLPVNIVFIGLLPSTVTQLPVLQRIVPGATAPLPQSPRYIDEDKMRAPFQLPRFLDTLRSRVNQDYLEMAGQLHPDPGKYLGAAFEYQYHIVYDVGALTGGPSARDDLAREIIDHSFFYPANKLLVNLGIPCPNPSASYSLHPRGPITTQQYYYSECQLHRVPCIKEAPDGSCAVSKIDLNYNVEANHVEDWLNHNVLGGTGYTFVDRDGNPARPIPGADTVFILSTYDSDDFRFHTYYFKDEPDPDMCLDSVTGQITPCGLAAPGSMNYSCGLLRDSRQMIRWGGDPGSRSFFYDVSAGPDNFTHGAVAPDNVTLPGYGFFIPVQLPIWEYGRNDGSPYAQAYFNENFWGWPQPVYPDLSLDVANAVRYGGVYFSFTQSPIYDPALNLPSGQDSDLANRVELVDHVFEGLAGFDGRATFNPELMAQEEQKLLPLSNVSVRMVDHADPQDALYFDADRARAFCEPFAPAIASTQAKDYVSVPLEAAYCGFTSSALTPAGVSAYGPREAVRNLDPVTGQVSVVGNAQFDLCWFIDDHEKAVTQPQTDGDDRTASRNLAADTRVPLFLFNTPDDLGNPLLVGISQADPVTMDKQSQVVVDDPRLYGIGYGATAVAIHEDGHFFGMSHPHDGYDWEIDQACDQFCRGVPGGSTDNLAYASCRLYQCGPGEVALSIGILNSGDEGHSVMNYMKNVWTFGQLDYDNHNRWLAVSFMNMASFLWGEIAAQPARAAAVAWVATTADAEIGTMMGEYARMNYAAAAAHAKTAFALMLGAAQAAHVSIDPTTWPGYHRFPPDFLLDTALVLEGTDRADDYLLEDEVDLTQAQELEDLSVAAGALPAGQARPVAPVDIPLRDADATVVTLSAAPAARPTASTQPGKAAFAKRPRGGPQRLTEPPRSARHHPPRGPE